MAAPITNLKMNRGDAFSFNLTVTTDGTATNLTGGTLRMTAKYKPEDTDTSAVFTRTSVGTNTGITVTNATSGLATVTLAATNTSGLPATLPGVPLFYDIQFTDSTGNPYTLVTGTLTVTPDISVTTP